MTFRAYIVDDSSTVRDNLIDTLRELAAIEPVGHSDNEHDARRWLLENDWDVAIIDLFLRVGSGMNVLQAVRRKRPGQRVVVLSNHSSRDVRWRCRQLGADAVFDKSTELEALVDYCRKMRGGDVPEAASELPAPIAPSVQPAA
jgi:two-component system, OmpR family, response regulator